MEASSGSSTDNSRAHLYKYKDHHKSQHERRAQFLEEQKEKRHLETDKNREACDLYLREIEESAKSEEFNEIEESVEKEEQVDNEEMEYEYCELKSRKRKTASFKLMLTEWFLDIPDDLEENWLIKLVPEGFRLLLITRNHYTAFYTQKGRFIFKLKTNFPGGGGNNINGNTVLDCIYNKPTKTIFILDCLFWNSMSILDSEADFRFYWLRTKFDEMEELSRCSNSLYTFILLDGLPAEKTLIQDKVADTFKKEEHELLYDGIVFYLKESQYTFGYTPLATWLSSYMLPEKLGIDVPEKYLAKKPEGYINLQHYVEHIKEFSSKKNKHGRKKEGTDKMEV